MIQITVADIKTDWSHLPERIAACEIYLIKDGNAKVLYVGRSHSVMDRLQSHLGEDWRNEPSRLGRFILGSEGSDAWPIELYAVEECKPFIDSYRLTLPTDLQDFCRQYPGFDAEMAERAMIKVLNPWLNVNR